MLLTKRRRLGLVRDEIGDCQRCGLCKERKNIVYGVGDPESPIVFVGEAPGADEDVKGEPFVGRAGQLLTKIIEAMGFTRETVYITNVVKCRPPNNRNPDPSEVNTCMPFLRSKLRIIDPLVIVALGNVACRALFGQETKGIMSIRGKWLDYLGTAVMPTFHPSFLLREPAAKRYVWKDMKEVLRFLAEHSITPPFPRRGGQ